MIHWGFESSTKCWRDSKVVLQFHITAEDETGFSWLISIHLTVCQRLTYKLGSCVVCKYSQCHTDGITRSNKLELFWCIGFKYLIGYLFFPKHPAAFHCHTKQHCIIRKINLLHNVYGFFYSTQTADEWTLPHNNMQTFQTCAWLTTNQTLNSPSEANSAVFCSSQVKNNLHQCLVIFVTTSRSDLPPHLFSL